MALTKTQKANLEYAHQWLMRSRKDFSAFKKLAPFDKKTYRVVRCSDPALAVYLLQQSIEKATKAVAAASGRYPHRKLRRFSHNSLALFLDFYANTLSLMLSSMRLKPMFDAFGLDAVGGLDKIIKLEVEAKETAKSKKKDEFALMSPEVIDRLLNFLLIIRNKAFLEVVRSVFGPHSKVRINIESIKMDSSEDFVDSMLSEVRTKLNIPELTEEQRKALIAFHGVLSSIRLGMTGNQSTEKTIELERGTKEWLSQWAMIALLLLASITVPHVSSSRYPVPKGRTRELGCGDYDEKLGIVNRLGRLGYVAELAIDDIEPQLDTVATFFSVAETVKDADKEEQEMGTKGRKNIKKPKKEKEKKKK